MNSDQRYKNFLVKNFLSELEGYKLYLDQESLSLWWIDLEKNKWIFELEYNGLLWWKESWGSKFMIRMGLTENDFKELIQHYVYITTKRKIFSFLSTEWILSSIFYDNISLKTKEIPNKGEVENEFLETILDTLKFN